jgi:hypothetical protein
LGDYLFRSSDTACACPKKAPGDWLPLSLDLSPASD